MMEAKKKAEQMEASILKEEEAIQTEKRKVEEYAKKLKELETGSLEKRSQLVNTKEEVKRIQVKVEKEIDKELGLEKDYFFYLFFFLCKLYLEDKTFTQHTELLRILTILTFTPSLLHY